MKITLETSGGIAYMPKLNAPVVIDTQQIEPDSGSQLETLVRESRFFEQPAITITVKKGAADYRTYTITVEDGSRTHSVQLTDPITDTNLEGLVALLQTLARPSMS